MIFELDRNGNLLSSDTSDALIQNSINANELLIRFKDTDYTTRYIPYIAFERADGKVSPLLPLATYNDYFKFTFNDSWLTAKTGNLKCSITLKENNVVKKTANIVLQVIPSISEDIVNYIDDVTYNTLVANYNELDKRINSINSFDLGVIEENFADKENEYFNAIKKIGFYKFTRKTNTTSSILGNREAYNSYVMIVGNSERQTPEGKTISVINQYIYSSVGSETIRTITTNIEGENVETSVVVSSNSYATTSELAQKLNKSETPNTLYGIDEQGNQTSYSFNHEPTPQSIVKRDNKGHLKVLEIPTQDTDATSKKYVDEKHAEAIAVAEGKTKSYVIKANDPNATPNDFNSQFAIQYQSFGKTASKDSTLLLVDGTRIKIWDLKIGDIILITEQEYPDRFMGNIANTSMEAYKTYGFYILETRKIDLTQMNKNTQDIQEIKNTLDTLNLYDYTFSTNAYVENGVLYVDGNVYSDTLVTKGSVVDGTLYL